VLSRQWVVKNTPGMGTKRSHPSMPFKLQMNVSNDTGEIKSLKEKKGKHDQRFKKKSPADK